MSKVDESLGILQTLVESAGGSIEPFRHILVKNADVTAEDEFARLITLCDTAIDGFFHCASKDVTFTNISRIEEFYGENYAC